MKELNLKIKISDEYFELLEDMANKGGWDNIDDFIIARIADILKFEKYYREIDKRDILSLIKT